MVYVLFLFGFTFIPGKWQEIKLSKVRSWPDCERYDLLSVKECEFCLHTTGSLCLLQNGECVEVLITF